MRGALTLLICIVLAGCSDPLAKYVAEKFPPISLDDQRQKAVDSAAEAMRTLNTPNVAFGASISAVEAVIKSKDLTEQGVTDVSLSTDRQLLKVEITFDRTFVSNDAGPADQTLLGTLAPHIRGKIVVYCGITSSTLEKDSGSTVLPLQLLPYIGTVEVASVEVAGKYDVTPAGDLIARLLNRYSDNISGAISKMPIMTVNIPTVMVDKSNLSRVITTNDTAVNGKFTLRADDITPPIKLYGVVSLIDDSQIMGIAQLVPLNFVPGSPTSVQSTFEFVKEVFGAHIQRAFEIEKAPSEIWVAIRKDIVAFAVNDAIRQASFCVGGDVDVAKQSFSQKVEFPDETGVDCTPTRDCSPTRDCTIARSHDDRDCSACILYRPEVKVFGKVVVSGGCVQHGNDPTCEFNKAAQNKIYDADYALRKADCERLKTQERVQCEAEKAGERALCETGKEALKRIARTGNFANLDGSFQGRGKLGVCLESFQLANDLSRVDLSVGATGQVKADVSLKFTPLDIVGHLTCQAPWTEKQTFDATVPNTSIPISSTIELNSLEGASTIGFNVAEIKFPLQLNPGPTEFLLKSANMTLACQGLNLLKPLLISATPFIPELKGNFEHVEKARHLDMHVELPSQEIGGVAIQAKLSTTPPALLVSGGVK